MRELTDEQMVDDYSHYDNFKVGDRVVLIHWKKSGTIVKYDGMYHIDVEGEIYHEDDLNIHLLTPNSALHYEIEYKPVKPSNVIAVDFTARKRV